MVLKLVRLQVFLYFQVSHIILCTAFYTRLITQSRDHDEVFSIKTEHEILIHNQQTKWMAPQNNGRTEKQKVTCT